MSIQQALALDASATDTEHAVATFASVRPRLFGIAYRMLGSAADAEDIVQDVWLRWQNADRAAVDNPAAFLATATTRLCINAAQSARARRETYVGPWLPEPVDTAADPSFTVERSEAIELAVLLLLERLSPPERAAYVLREAFGYPYRQIAEIIQTTEVATRQLVSRARRHLAAERKAPVPAPQHRELLSAFLTAAKTGDLEALEELFATEIVSYSDGGGVVRASRIPVRGRNRVARFVRAFANRFWVGVDVAWLEANGRDSVILSREGTVFAFVTVTASVEGIDQLLWVMNPAKLEQVAHAGA